MNNFTPIKNTVTGWHIDEVIPVDYFFNEYATDSRFETELVNEVLTYCHVQPSDDLNWQNCIRIIVRHIIKHYLYYMDEMCHEDPDECNLFITQTLIGRALTDKAEALLMKRQLAAFPSFTDPYGFFRV